MTEAIRRTLSSDPKLGPIVAEHGLPDLEVADDEFARLVVSILRQQVSMASAAATRERLFDAVEVTPEGILAADEERLREAGLSRQKARYVRNVARAFQEEDYSREALSNLDDEAVVDRLTDITGVGEWTANMYLLFVLGREDVFPVGDLGIRRAMERLYGHESRAEMREHAESWRPYRSYASLVLWRHVE